MAAAAIKKFLGKPGIQVRKRRGLLVLSFEDKVALRFKKFRGRTMRTASNNTGQTEMFNAQALEFADKVTPMTHVTAGYFLDELGLSIELLAITCMVDGKHLWAAIEIITKPQPVKQMPVKQPQSTPAARVRSTRKKADNADKAEGESPSS